MPKSEQNILNNNVLIVSPFKKDDQLYPHLFDFLEELSRKADVTYMYISERGYWIERLFELKLSIEKLKEWFKLCNSIYSLIRKSKQHQGPVVAIDNFAYFICSYLFAEVPVVLWSHDFVSSDNPASTHWAQRFLRKQVRKALSKRRKILIQSEKRLSVFHRSYAPLPELDVFLFPVSLCPAKLSKLPIMTKPVVLQIGGINCTRSNSHMLIKSYQDSSSFELILHGFIDKDVVSQINSSEKVPLMSSVPLKSSHIAQIVNRCNIGFISYVANDMNFKELAYASGQAVEFLRCGKPILVHGNTSLTTWIVSNRLGIEVKDFSLIDLYIHDIMAEYSAYSSRASEMFSHQLNIQIYMPKLKKFIYD